MNRQIEVWLNDHWFRRPDLYPTFRKIHRLGADLDYATLLCGFLTLGDYVRRQAGFHRRRGLLPVSLPAPKNLGHLHLSQVPSLSDRELKRLLDLRQRGYRELDSYFDSLAAACRACPPMRVFLQFAFPTELFNDRGEPHDRWGSFFLLAISEHFRSLKGHKPRYVLTYELLRKLRKDQKPISNPKIAALQRIKRLRRQYRESDLESALAILVSEYRVAAARPSRKG